MQGLRTNDNFSSKYVQIGNYVKLKITVYLTIIFTIWLNITLNCVAIEKRLTIR